MRPLPARGVPQGSGTGPVCFSEVFYEVLINIKNNFKNVEVIAKVDDLCLLISWDFKEEIITQVTECFEAMDAELNKYILKLQVKKLSDSR